MKPLNTDVVSNKLNANNYQPTFLCLIALSQIKKFWHNFVTIAKLLMTFMFSSMQFVHAEKDYLTLLAINYYWHLDLLF